MAANLTGTGAHDRLVEAWRADRRGSAVPHVVIGLPSYSVDRTVYEHYGDRVAPLEYRYLYCTLFADEPTTRVAYLSSLPVPDDVADCYFSLLPPGRREEMRSRVLLLDAGDRSHRPLAEKLLDRPDKIDALRRWIGDEPAIVEPWNVTASEQALAEALDLPMYGADPACAPLATKTGARRLFRAVGVPHPVGAENVHDAREAAAALVAIRRAAPLAEGVVVKLDDSVAGDGNVVVRFADMTGIELDEQDVVAGWLDAHFEGWYAEALRAGGVVEELIAGRDFRSPSVQATITPEGDVVVLSTHEQRLGGATGQVYQGCTLPADGSYAPWLAEQALRVGAALAADGALGRFAVDFAAVRDERGTWALYALEINLRKGGTTHPYGITRYLTGASYDPAGGRLVGDDGNAVHYGATDNLADPDWVGLTPRAVREAAAQAGVAYDRATRAGVVHHLLDCLAVDGRMGYTALGRTAEEALAVEARFVDAVRDAAGRTRPARA